jgi:DnaK suppressor protein
MAEKKAKKPGIKISGKKKTKPVAKKVSVPAKPKSVKKTRPAPRPKIAPPKSVKKTKPAPRPKIAPSPSSAKKETEEERNLRLRRLLVEKRKEILKEIINDTSRYIKGESKQLVDTALDDGDWSIVDLAEDINLKHLSSHRDDLQKLDEAIRKLNEGTYGICEDCGDEISEKRLNILPYAIYCIDCKEKREKIEEMQRREGLL